MSNISSISASAPSKIILCGEYAVLEGAPCLVIAANRRVNAQLQCVKPSGSLIELHSPGFLSTPETLKWGENGWCNNNPSLQLLLKLLNKLASKHIQKQHWKLSIDTRALFDGKQKLGLGSSAALAVALYGMFESFSERQSIAERWKIIHHAHSLAQGKQGSGVDIAASLSGAVTRFVNVKQQSCEINSIELPEKVHLAFVWTGSSASTPRFLRSLGEWRASAPRVYTQHMNDLRERLDSVFSDMPGPESTKSAEKHAETFVANLKAFTRALCEFARASELPIFAQGHQQLYELSETFAELCYKPCGAGGGDLGLVAASNSESLEQFLIAVRERGFTRVDLNIDPNGLKTSIEP